MEEDLGFGAVERCQAAIGIKCSDCIYRDACLIEGGRTCFNERSD